VTTAKLLGIPNQTLENWVYTAGTHQAKLISSPLWMTQARRQMWQLLLADTTNRIHGFWCWFTNLRGIFTKIYSIIKFNQIVMLFA